jgi:LPXTG-motif cell wall-anchored protein
LSDDVVAGVPDWVEQCKLEGETITCAVGSLDPGQTVDVTALTLASRVGAKVGEAGEITAAADAAEDDAYPDNDSVTSPVTIIASGPDLIVAADDVTTAKDPVGAGDTRPFYAAVGNQGDSAATNATIALDLPTGATVVERYSDCKYTTYYPKATNSDGYIYGPGNIVCPLPTLEPGEGLLLFNPETGESAFHVLFGRNVSGPEKHSGSLQAALPEQTLAAKGVQRVAGDGPSFAAKLKELQQKPVASAKASPKQKTALREIDESNNFADFSFWSKKNTIDIRVTAQPVAGKVGQTVDLTFEVANLGPSDGGGPSVLITTPSGTVLVPGKWCQSVGSDLTHPGPSKWGCFYESEYPTVHSGAGTIKATVGLKITSKPGTDGTISAQFCCVASTETNKANNTARIVFTTAEGGAGGSGGGLPITGSNTALIAGAGGAIVVIGVVLALMFRRRRVAFRLPQD